MMVRHDRTASATATDDTKVVGPTAVVSARASRTRSESATYLRLSSILEAVVMSMHEERKVLKDDDRQVVASAMVLERPTLNSTRGRGMET